MILFRPGSLILSASLFPFTVIAQETTKFEIFGGYSYLRLTEQSSTLLKPANLNGWNGSGKLNVTPRIGLLADFSGHYGQRGALPLTWYSPMSGELQQFGRLPADMRQHTFLLGPEVRLLRRDRLSVNVRALMGVAHTNTLVLKYREPFQLPGSSAPPITEKTFPSASALAASFGGSLDYRITDRLSYRIIQPELFLTRLAIEAAPSGNQYNLRLSTGIVFTAGESQSRRSAERQFSVGVIGGAGLTDAFGHESTGFFDGEQRRSRSYSTLKDYIIGPTIDVRLPWGGLSVEFDALYRPMNLTMATVQSDGSLLGVSPATVVTWQFPALLKYTFRSRALNPFIETGPSFRASGNLNGASPSIYGATAGVGMEAHLGKLRIGPLVRYTHWAADADHTSVRSKRNQIELLLGLAF